MHKSVPRRKLLSSAVFACALIPVISLFLGILLDQAKSQTVVQVMQFWLTNPLISGAGISTVLLMAIVAWKKGVSWLPEIVLIPLAGVTICGFAGAFSPVVTENSVHDLGDAQEPMSLSISADCVGTDVWCNGIFLGKSPLKITASEFYEKVTPLDSPPQQAVLLGGKEFQPNHTQWSAIPYSLEKRRSRSQMTLAELSEEKYWWTFQKGTHIVFGRNLHSGSSPSTQYLRVENSTLRRHVSLIEQLAKHESVDFMTAYSDHFQRYPEVRTYLLNTKQKAKNAQNNDIQDPLDVSTEAQQTVDWDKFTKAVWEEDWAVVARSKFPEAEQLLLNRFAEMRRRHGFTTLTFGKDLILRLLDSDLAEVHTAIREELQNANSSHIAIASKYIRRQVELGADRKELMVWLASLKNRLHTNYANLAMLTKAENIGDLLTDDDIIWLNKKVATDPPPSFIAYLVKRWKKTPGLEVMKILNQCTGNPLVQSTLAETDLSNSVRAKDLSAILAATSTNRSSQLSLLQATGKALSEASDPEHVTQLVYCVYYLQSAVDNALEALAQYDGPEHRELLRQKESLLTRQAEEQTQYQWELQLARDLIAGKKTPADLQKTVQLVWKDGQYVVLQEDAPE